MLQSLGCSRCLWIREAIPKASSAQPLSPVVRFGIHPFWRWIQPPQRSFLALDPSRGGAEPCLALPWDGILEEPIPRKSERGSDLLDPPVVIPGCQCHHSSQSLGYFHPLLQPPARSLGQPHSRPRQPLRWNFLDCSTRSTNLLQSPIYLN